MEEKIPTDGREKSQLMEEKTPIVIIFENGKYPMQKGKYPMQKPCRKGLVSDGTKKSRLMEEKNPN